MSQYGKLLERYEENNHEVNDSVLTMMHHIAGDCDKHEVLLQFPIIEKMARICDYSSLSVVCIYIYSILRYYDSFHTGCFVLRYDH